MATTSQQAESQVSPAPQCGLSADLEQAVIALWPSLPVEQRKLWFDVLDTFLPPDAELLETLEDLETARALAARTPAEREIIPMDQAMQEIGYTRR